MDELDGFNLEQIHGKERARVARVWRTKEGLNLMVKWNVGITLFSDCLPAYVTGDNSDIVATDTMKNMLGSERHTTEVTVKKSGSLKLVSSIEGLSVLKTTMSGFEGFIRDNYTALPDTRERMLATEVTASWRYSYETLSGIPTDRLYFNDRYLEAKGGLMETFFGPPEGGGYNPSVQSTLYHMARAALNRSPDISAVNLKMPNLHFLPVNISSKESTSIVKFADDVYLPTDEPHGIEASLSRFWSRM